MVPAWGALWRIEARDEFKEAGWRAKREEFVESVAKALGSERGRHEGKGDGKEGKEKGKGDPEERKYVYHENDRN